MNELPPGVTRIAAYALCSGGALRDEAGGSTDRCAWLTREETRAVRLVDLARLARRLAWAAADRSG